MDTKTSNLMLMFQLQEGTVLREAMNNMHYVVYDGIDCNYCFTVFIILLNYEIHKISSLNHISTYSQLQSNI